MSSTCHTVQLSFRIPGEGERRGVQLVTKFSLPFPGRGDREFFLPRSSESHSVRRGATADKEFILPRSSVVIPGEGEKQGVQLVMEFSCHSGRSGETRSSSCHGAQLSIPAGRGEGEFSLPFRGGDGEFRLPFPERQGVQQQTCLIIL